MSAFDGVQFAIMLTNPVDRRGEQEAPKIRSIINAWVFSMDKCGKDVFERALNNILAVDAPVGIHS